MTFYDTGYVPLTATRHSNYYFTDSRDGIETGAVNSPAKTVG